jgi:glycosyltransferase involved in cell wall biosynthesis
VARAHWEAEILRAPDLSVVICSLNGADGVDRCLRALGSQTIRPSVELVVVDDGSTDATSEVARAHGAIVVRHDECRGLSAARNSGIRVASAPVIGFLDDDCEPDPDWAEKIVAGFSEDVLALGGALALPDTGGLMFGYLARHNPLDPQELELTKSGKLPYRLWLYLKRQWQRQQLSGRREVASFAGGNMSVRRSSLLAIAGFDERIRFGGDDDDLFRRLRRAFPSPPLIFDPDVRVVHHFAPSLRDTLRRSRAYGRGQAFMNRKWPIVRPTIFPFPIVILITLVLSVQIPYLLVASVILPQLFYPKGLRAAVSGRDARCLLDAYIQLAQETFSNYGFIAGWWRFRNFDPEYARNSEVVTEANWES